MFLCQLYLCHGLLRFNRDQKTTTYFSKFFLLILYISVEQTQIPIPSSHHFPSRSESIAILQKNLNFVVDGAEYISFNYWLLPILSPKFCFLNPQSLSEISHHRQRKWNAFLIHQ